MQGYELEFDPEKFPPSRDRPIHQFKRNAADAAMILEEIHNLQAKDVVEQCEHEKGEFISNIFTRPKKSGGTRLILDLSDLNKSVVYQHFKMDNIHTALTLISPNCFVASVDLRDAYYTVPIHPDSRKYLRFMWNGTLWQFKVLPNGLSSAPRLFTKILKPVFAKLREQGHIVVGYLDDTLIMGKTATETKAAVVATTSLLTELGFIVHPHKSVLDPVQEITFLGFRLKTKEMVVELPKDKKHDIAQSCTKLINEVQPSIRLVARVIGQLVATFPAVQYGALYYRSLEKDKICALSANKGHYDRHMTLSVESINELRWWIKNLQSQYRPIQRDRPTIEIHTDASGKGWGATDLTVETGGRWNDTEMKHARHNEINVLETIAVSHGLRAFCSDIRNVHVLVRVDNTTAEAYLNNMGGTKSHKCNEKDKQNLGVVYQ